MWGRIKNDERVAHWCDSRMNCIRPSGRATWWALRDDAHSPHGSETQSTQSESEAAVRAVNSRPRVNGAGSPQPKWRCRSINPR
jgi:hypothetical protein